MLVKDENTKDGVPISITSRVSDSDWKPMPRNSRKNPIPATTKTGAMMFKISLGT